MSGKSQTIGDFTVCRLSQILPTNENSKSYISPIVWDGRGQIWRIGSVSIFPTRPRFLRWSAIIPDEWKLKFVSSGTSAMDFAHYQSPKLLGSSPPITQVSIFGALSISGQINRENLRQTCGDYPIYLGRSTKSKIPDRLGFSRLKKTRLNIKWFAMGKKYTS